MRLFGFLKKVNKVRKANANCIKRDKYTFLGERAVDAAEYYDKVLSYGYTGDMNFLAWEAAHKFCAKLVCEEFVSFGNGIVFGEKANDAIEYIQVEYKKAYDACEEYGCRKKMIAEKQRIYAQAEILFDVKIKRY